MSNKEPAGPAAHPPERMEGVQDSRRFPRIQKIIPGEILLEEHTRPARIFVLDISLGGAKCTNHFSMPKDRDFLLKMYLVRNDPPVETRARMAWQRELAAAGTFEIGIEFSTMTDETKERLSQYLEQIRQEEMEKAGQHKKFSPLARHA
ncbi:MAG: PilZ domain-containing protein [Candidatus Eremiobacteraeota bacterium]|nr:PilZ domain-containing protein [Candidatus Eremiobacteraeota bacterium]